MGDHIYVEHERRHGILQKDGRPEGYNICVTKNVKAPVERVLAALVASIPPERVTRVREGKDVRATWLTPGTAPRPTACAALGRPGSTRSSAASKPDLAGTAESRSAAPVGSATWASPLP